jgi:ADP-ribose pyrophosphatase YjhB (NUDIX family)
MKPDNVDSNLYQYHLKLLLKSNLIAKRPTEGYRLTAEGLRYIDYVSLKTFEPRRQPKTLTKLFVTNDDDQVLLWPKYKQPFISRWNLPSGKAHFEDLSLEDSARRELGYLTDEDNQKLDYRGVIEHTVDVDAVIVTHTISHVFETTATNIISELAAWKSAADITQLDLSPGTKETLDDLHKHKQFFHTSHHIHSSL